MGTVVITAADTTPPTVTSITANPSTWTKNASVNISGTLADNENLTYYFWKCRNTDSYQTAVAEGAGSANFSFSCSFESSGATGQTASIYAMDFAGNESAVSTIQYFIDRTAPGASDNYTDDAWKATAQTVTLSFSDAHSGVNTGTRLYCVSSTDTCTPNVNYTAPVSVSTQGTNYLRYQVTDNAGNVGAVQSKRVRIDTSEPNNPTTFVGQLGSAGGTNLSGATITTLTPSLYFSWSGASDPESGIGNYQIVLQQTSAGGGQWVYSPLVGNVSSYTLNVTTPALENGKSYHYWIRAQNGAGINRGDFQGGQVFTVNTTPAATSEQKCVGWKGKWTGANSSAGTCSFADTELTADRIALHKDIVGTSQVICQSFSMNNGSVTGCTSTSPLWATANFTAPTGAATHYIRKTTPTHGVDLNTKNTAFSCNTTDRYLPNDYTGNSQPGKGDYCAQRGQKLRDQLNYAINCAGSDMTCERNNYFSACAITAGPACSCTTTALPLGPEYVLTSAQVFTSTGANITGSTLRVRSFVSTDRPGGQCVSPKITKCLYLGGQSRTDTIYYLDANSVPRCRVPGPSGQPPLVYSWVNNDWSLQGCPDGSQVGADGQCTVACGAADEGNSKCCANGISWWHWNAGTSSGTCVPPQKYECEIIMKSGVPAGTSANLNLYRGSYAYDGETPSGVFKSTLKACNVSCNDADGLSGVSVQKPSPTTPQGWWQWRPGASTLDLLLNASTAPFFQGGTSGACDWECKSGYVRSGDNCVEESTTDIPPSPVGEELPPHPRSNLTAEAYAALLQKTVAYWNSTYFRSPALDAASADQLDFWMRFRIPRDAAVPSLESREILRWRILGKNSDGQVMTLTARKGCFDPKNNGSGSHLCLDHFRTANYYDPRVVDDSTEAFFGVRFQDPEGTTNDGDVMKLSEFLTSGIAYPVIKFEYINPLQNQQNVTIPLQYQFFLDTPSEIPSLPAGIPLLRAIAEVSGLKSILEAYVTANAVVPVINYVLSQ